MGSRSCEMHNALTNELEAHGVDTFRFEASKNHNRLVVEHAGRSRFMVYSTHTPDRRAMKNNVAKLRGVLRELGVAA